MIHAVRTAPLIAAVLLVTIFDPPSARADGHLEAADRGADFLLGTQTGDGGFGLFGQSLDAVIALRSVGIDPATAARGGRSAAEFLHDHAAEANESPGLAGKAALAAAALGLDPRSLGGVDLPGLVESAFDAATGLYGEDSFTQAAAILGLACTGNTVPAEALEALRAQALEDGGWGFAGASDPDTTAIAVQALLAGGGAVDDAEVQAALAYFEVTQTAADGGWGFGESNTSSTAFAVQAILAAGEDPGGPRFLSGGSTPLDYLRSQQAGDGSFAGFDPAFATNQVVPALAGRTFCDAAATPIERAAPAAPPAGTGLAAPAAAGSDPVIRLALLLLFISAIAAVASTSRR